LRDNSENNHFYIQQIKLCSKYMANVWKDPNVVIKDAIAKSNAWREFVGHFPKADRSRFIAQGNTDGKKVTKEIFFKEGPGSLQSVFGSDKKYWSEEIKKALCLEDKRSGAIGGFPFQLAPLGSKVSLAIPAVPFDGKAPSLKKIFDAPIQIYVTPDQYFTTKFQEMFQDTKLRHTSGTE